MLFACTWKLEKPGFPYKRKLKKYLSAREKIKN
jgi:hypothetical protein